MAYVSYNNQEPIEPINVGKVSADRQIELIKKYQKGYISQPEKTELIGSLHKLIISQAKRFSTSLSDRSLNDIVSDGVANVWMRLLKYNEYRTVKVEDENGKITEEIRRIVPSTYVSIVLRTGFSKDIQKSKVRMSRKTLRIMNSKGELEEKVIRTANTSLNGFLGEDDKEYEPTSLSLEDNSTEKVEDKLTFNSMIIQMYNSVCLSLEDYKILNNLLDVRLLPRSSGGRNRQCVSKIADIHNVDSKVVNRVAKRVGPWLDKFDFIPHILRGDFNAPTIKDVFNEDSIDKMIEEEVDDVWDIMKEDDVLEELV